MLRTYFEGRNRFEGRSHFEGRKIFEGRNLSSRSIFTCLPYLHRLVLDLLVVIAIAIISFILAPSFCAPCLGRVYNNHDFATFTFSGLLIVPCC